MLIYIRIYVDNDTNEANEELYKSHSSDNGKYWRNEIIGSFGLILIQIEHNSEELTDKLDSR